MSACLLLLNFRLLKTRLYKMLLRHKFKVMVTGPALRGGLAPSINMLAFPPPINKLSLLKTAAFVLNFKIWPPKSTALAPALGGEQ